MAINLFVKGNTLQELVEEYATKVYLKDNALAPLEDALKKVKVSLAHEQETMVGVAGHDEQVARYEGQKKALEEQIAAIRKDADYKFEFSEVKGLKALGQQYRKAETKSEKAVAIAHFFNLHGFTRATDVACMDYVEGMGGLRKNSRKARVENARMTKERAWSNDLFFAILFDAYMDAGLIKEDIIPEELKEMYAEERRLAEKRKAERKAEREAAKKAKKANK